MNTHTKLFEVPVRGSWLEIEATFAYEWSDDGTDHSRAVLETKLRDWRTTGGEVLDGFDYNTVEQQLPRLVHQWASENINELEQ